MRELTGPPEFPAYTHSLRTVLGPVCAVSPFHIYILSPGGQELNLTHPGFTVTLPSAQHRLFVSVLNAKATCRLLFILQNPA